MKPETASTISSTNPYEFKPGMEQDDSIFFFALKVLSMEASLSKVKYFEVEGTPYELGFVLKKKKDKTSEMVTPKKK